MARQRSWMEQKRRDTKARRMRQLRAEWRRMMAVDRDVAGLIKRIEEKIDEAILTGNADILDVLIQELEK